MWRKKLKNNQKCLLHEKAVYRHEKKKSKTIFIIIHINLHLFTNLRPNFFYDAVKIQKRILSSSPKQRSFMNNSTISKVKAPSRSLKLSFQAPLLIRLRSFQTEKNSLAILKVYFQSKWRRERETLSLAVESWTESVNSSMDAVFYTNFSHLFLSGHLAIQYTILFYKRVYDNLRLLWLP